jgi:hypothetical protein
VNDDPTMIHAAQRGVQLDPIPQGGTQRLFGHPGGAPHDWKPPSSRRHVQTTIVECTHPRCDAITTKEAPAEGWSFSPNRCPLHVIKAGAPCECSDELVPGVKYPWGEECPWGHNAAGISTALATAAAIERCDICERFPDDESAAKALGEVLGLEPVELGGSFVFMGAHGPLTVADADRLVAAHRQHAPSAAYHDGPPSFPAAAAAAPGDGDRASAQRRPRARWWPFLCGAAAGLAVLWWLGPTQPVVFFAMLVSVCTTAALAGATDPASAPRGAR